MDFGADTSYLQSVDRYSVLPDTDSLILSAPLTPIPLHSDMSRQRSLQLPEKRVVKANRMVRAKVELTKLEQQVLAALIAEVSKEDSRFRLLQIRVRDLIRRSSSNSEDFFSRGKEICQSLLDANIEIQVEGGDGERTYSGVNLFSRCDYVEGKGLIKARFAQDMETLLLGLEGRFTMYLLQFILQLDRRYSMRIYEILKMREWLGTFELSVQEFREILGLENKYDSFSHLRKFVIEPSRKEIGKKTDIQFTYRVERDGRTPTNLRFYVHEEGRDKFPASATEVDDDQIEKPGEKTDTTGPKLDVRDIFLKGLSQEQIGSINNLDELEQEAIRRAREGNPNRSWTVIAYTAAKIMEDMWSGQ